MARVLIGSSNIYRNYRALAFPRYKEYSMVRCVDIESFKAQVGNLEPAETEIVISVIENFIEKAVTSPDQVERMKELHTKLEIDVAAYCKHKINFKHKRNANGFNQLFKGGEAAIQSIAAHNVHKNVGRVQQRGTSLLLFRHLTKQLDKNESRKDETGLGRWSVTTLQGDNVRTRIICDITHAGMQSSAGGLLISSKGGTS
jgi:hypothetical protein